MNIIQTGSGSLVSEIKPVYLYGRSGGCTAGGVSLDLTPYTHIILRYWNVGNESPYTAFYNVHTYSYSKYVHGSWDRYADFKRLWRQYTIAPNGVWWTTGYYRNNYGTDKETSEACVPSQIWGVVLPNEVNVS